MPMTTAPMRQFICERHAYVDLLDGLKTPCSCGMSSHPWVLDTVVQVSLLNCAYGTA